MRDYESTNVEAAAYLSRHDPYAVYDSGPTLAEAEADERVVDGFNWDEPVRDESE